MCGWVSRVALRKTVLVLTDRPWSIVGPDKELHVNVWKLYNELS